MIGDQHQGPLVAQAIEVVEIEAAGTEQAENPEVDPEADAGDEAPEGLADTCLLYTSRCV